MSKDEVAIRIEGVYKDFSFTSARSNTLKSVFTSLHKSKDKNTKTQHALKDINLEIKKGEFFGIVGRNGSGKSTLLKIIAGIYQPSKGHIDVNGKLVPFIELGVGFNPELTGKENVYLNGAMLGFSDKEVDKFYDEVVEFAELEKFMDKKLKNYSSGMQVRLAFSMAIRAKADILLVDEVLAVGDADFQRKCFSYFKKLKKDKKTVIFVTHDMGAVKEFCDRGVLINDSVVQTVGRPVKIANLYSRMFMDVDLFDSKEKQEAKRWGTKDAYYENIKVVVDGKNIIVTADIVATKKLNNEILYGIHISSEDDKEITATNNRMIRKNDINGIAPDKRYHITWTMLNIFNDGKFYITLTLADSVSTVYDWYTEAGSFKIKKIERSTTSVLPPIDVNIIS